MEHDIAEWLRRTRIDVAGEVVAAREAAAKELAGLDAVGWDDLLEISRSPRRADPAALEDVIKTIRKHDSAFLSSSDVDIAIVASAAIAMFVNTSSAEDAALVALEVVNASFGGFRPGHYSGFIEASAEQALAVQSAALRNAPKVLGVAPPIRPVGSNAEPSVLMNELKQLSGDTQASVSFLAKQNEQSMRRVSLLQEEANVLWWLFGGHAFSLRVPFAEVPNGIAPVILGAELGGLISEPPGPLSATKILSRALAAVPNLPRELTPVDIALVLPAPWRADLTSLGASKNRMAPLHALISQSAEVGGVREALVKWSQEYLEFDASTPRSVNAIAIQAYRERLALRAAHGSAS